MKRIEYRKKQLENIIGREYENSIIIGTTNKFYTQSSGKLRPLYLYNGIDRVNSNLGYMDSNCEPCCEICNKAKRNLTKDEFIIWIGKLINNNLNGFK